MMVVVEWLIPHKGAFQTSTYLSFVHTFLAQEEKFIHSISLVPRPTREGREGVVFTVCACAECSWNVKNPVIPTGFGNSSLLLPVLLRFLILWSNTNIAACFLCPLPIPRNLESSVALPSVQSKFS